MAEALTDLTQAEDFLRAAKYRECVRLREDDPDWLDRETHYINTPFEQLKEPPGDNQAGLVAIQHGVGVPADPEAKQRMRCVSAARLRHVWNWFQGRLV